MYKSSAPYYTPVAAKEPGIQGYSASNVVHSSFLRLSRKAWGLDPWQPGLYRAFQTMVTISQFNVVRVWPARRIMVGSHRYAGPQSKGLFFFCTQFNYAITRPTRSIIYIHYRIFQVIPAFSFLPLSSKLLESLSPSATLCLTPHHHGHNKFNPRYN